MNLQEHLHDADRLAALRSFALLDSPTEQAFDRLTRLATRFLEAPVALVSLVDADRQFFKSCVGLPEPYQSTRETPLEMSFCQHNRTPGQAMVIHDARSDDTLRDNASVQELGVVAYLGYPLTTDDGHVLGSFCVLDSRPRPWSEEDIDTIRELAASVMSEVQLRAEQTSRRLAEGQRDELERLTCELEKARELADQTMRQLEQRNQQLLRANAEFERFAYVASHDLQEPVRTIGSFAQILTQRYSSALDEDGLRALGYLKGASDRMSELIRSLLDFSRIGDNARIAEVDLEKLLDDVLSDLALLSEDSSASISRTYLPTITGFPAELRSLFQNLVGNAIKFAKPDSIPEITVSARDDEDAWTLSVSDNGVGIDPRFHERVFEIFQQLEPGRAAGGTGIGLAQCKKIVEMHDGRIWIESTVDEGTTFGISLPKRPEAAS